MVQFSDKELEKEIAAFAKSLAWLPPSDELLPLFNVLEKHLVASAKSLAQRSSSDELLTPLNNIEALLSQVKEAPAQSVKDAVSRLMKALNVNDLLKHSDVEVRVGVAYCISEITRINAPLRVYARSKRTCDTSVKAALEILINLPGIVPGSEFWNYACTLLTQKNMRQVFVLQPSHESRLSWLEYNYDEYKGN